MIRSIYWENDTVFMLDQTLLPVEIRYIECRDAGMVAEGIRSLRVRRAPEIRIAAGMGLTLAGQGIDDESADDPGHREAVARLAGARQSEPACGTRGDGCRICP